MQTQILSVVAKILTCQRSPRSLPIYFQGQASVLAGAIPHHSICNTSSLYTGHHALAVATPPEPSNTESVSDTQVLIVKFCPSTNWMSTPAWLNKGEGRNYKSTERSCLQDPDNLASTRVKALFSVTSRSFMCFKDWICFICCSFCRNQRNRSENEKKIHMYIRWAELKENLEETVLFKVNKLLWKESIKEVAHSWKAI